MQPPPAKYHVIRCAIAVIVSILLGVALVAQSGVRSWGLCWTDTDAREGAIVHVAAAAYSSAVVREDGRILNCGAVTPCLGRTFPMVAGLRFLKVALGYAFTLGLRSDGAVVALGALDTYGTPIVVPPLPPGVRYVDIEASLDHGLLLRSDGAVVGVGSNVSGQLNVPTIATGVRVLNMAAGAGHSVLCLSDGSVMAFGRNVSGECNVPPLPPGLAYTQVSACSFTTAAIRSDGALLVWGDNTFGQCNVPAGSYQSVAVGGGHTVAWRSDGVFVAFGDNSHGQISVPLVAPGAACKHIDAGSLHTIALMTDGTVLAWGNDAWQQCSVPTPPVDAIVGGRGRFVSVASGGIYTAAVFADGTLRTWGDPTLSAVPLPVPNKNFKRIELGYGMATALDADGNLVSWGGPGAGSRIAVPPLPPGMTYVEFDDCAHHTAAIRSDGTVVRYGSTYGTIPPLPAGQSYIAVDAEQLGDLLLRSDGTVICIACGGATTSSMSDAQGIGFVKIANCNGFAGALRADGSLFLWGSIPANPNVGTSTWRALPPLPTGVVYVEISGGNQHIAARRSDGQVVVGGATYNWLQHMVPPLQPGTSYVEVDGGDFSVAARVGPTSTYISFYPGCSGSRPATRLIPADTPRIGHTLEVRLFDLPTDFAFVALGFARTSPIPLDFAGMPGCEAHISLDQIAFAAGQGGVATIQVPIPDRRALIGARFYHQAFVLDPTAGNAAGAVVSAAAEAVVGDW